jgi:hypothetical protein
MPAIVGHTITIWVPWMYRPEHLQDDGFLGLPFKDPSEVKPPHEEGRLIDHLREQWVNAERSNCHKPFQVSEVSIHVNGHCAFTVHFIEHEGDCTVFDKLLHEARTGWRYDDGSTPVRVHHMNEHLE